MAKTTIDRLLDILEKNPVIALAIIEKTDAADDAATGPPCWT